MRIIVLLILGLFFSCSDSKHVDLQQENEMLKSEIMELKKQTAPDILQQEIDDLKEQNALLQAEIDSCYQHSSKSEFTN